MGRMGNFRSWNFPSPPITVFILHKTEIHRTAYRPTFWNLSYFHPLECSFLSNKLPIHSPHCDGCPKSNNGNTFSNIHWIRIKHWNQHNRILPNNKRHRYVLRLSLRVRVLFRISWIQYYCRCKVLILLLNIDYR